MEPTPHAAREVAPSTWRRRLHTFHWDYKVPAKEPRGRSRSRSPPTSRQQQQRELRRIRISCVKRCEQLAAVAELERQALAMMEEARWRRRRLEEDIAEKQDIAEEQVRTPSEDLV